MDSYEQIKKFKLIYCYCLRFERTICIQQKSIFFSHYFRTNVVWFERDRWVEKTNNQTKESLVSHKKNYLGESNNPGGVLKGEDAKAGGFLPLPVHHLPFQGHGVQGHGVQGHGEVPTDPLPPPPQPSPAKHRKVHPDTRNLTEICYQQPADPRLTPG